MKETKPKKRTVRDFISVARKYDINSKSDPRNIRLALEELGPTFVKLGQIIATQPGVFSPELCAELRCLRDEVTPMSIEEVDQVIFDAYGKSKEQVFEYFDDDAHGSASISQVHHARLRSGEDVAVKIQRIGARETMEADIAFLRRVAKRLPFLRNNPLIDINDIIDGLWNTTQLELDFENEANNIERFYELNKDIKYSTCPKVYKEYSAPTIVVMEYINGFNMNDKEALIENGYDLEEIGRKYIRSFLKQAFIDGFFQADPHIGNLRIRGGQIVWYDLGMMGNFSQHDRDNMTKAIESIITGDTVRGYEALTGIMRLPSKYNKEELYKDIDSLIGSIAGKGIDSLDLNAEIQMFMQISKKHKAIVDGTFTLLSRGITVLQGTVEDIFPELDFFDEVRQFAIDTRLTEDDSKKDKEIEFLKKSRKIRRIMKIPESIANMLGLSSKGLAPVKMEMGASEKSQVFFDEIVKMVVDGIIIVALLVSSSIIMLTGLKPLVWGMPLIGLVGYSIALILVIISFKNRIPRR